MWEGTVRWMLGSKQPSQESEAASKMAVKGRSPAPRQKGWGRQGRPEGGPRCHAVPSAVSPGPRQGLTEDTVPRTFSWQSLDQPWD